MADARSELPEPDGNDILPWVEYCGGDSFAFQKAFAGRQIYIPIGVTHDHPLAKAIGIDAATRLCEELRGDMFHVPMGRHSKSYTRRILVWLGDIGGLKLNALAEATEMTVRNVCRVKRDLRADGLLPPARGAQNSLENEGS